MRKALRFLFFMTLVGCASSPRPAAGVREADLIPDSQYYSLLEEQTQKDQTYNGLNNVLNVSATVMTTQLSMAQIDHNDRIFQYTETQYKTEKGTAQSNLAKQTEFFLSFFVQERKYDDLAKKTTRWKIFLDVAGQRYEPKVIKLKATVAELQELYPDHTRWSTPYRLIFPVPTSIVENGKATLTLTGPLTSTVLNFNSDKK